MRLRRWALDHPGTVAALGVLAAVAVWVALTLPLATYLYHLGR